MTPVTANMRREGCKQQQRRELVAKEIRKAVKEVRFDETDYTLYWKVKCFKKEIFCEPKTARNQ